VNLYEFEGKRLFREFGIPVPEGRVIKTPEEAEQETARQGQPVVLKIQILSGKRGKAGGVQFAQTPEEAREVASQLLGRVFGGEKVHSLLVEEKLSIAQEFYAGLTIDPREGKVVLLVSGAGGMDVEEMAGTGRSDWARLLLDGISPLRRYQLYALLKKIGVKGQVLPKMADILLHLKELFFAVDATTVEVNPLVLTTTGQILAADAKIVLDDAAAFRRGRYNPDRVEDLPPLEKEARQARLSYVPLGTGGNIGIIAGGAGLGLATMDMVAAHGGKPRNFLDTGGGVTEEQMATALRIVAKTPGVEGILINVFGGINNCAVMARGITRVIREDGLSLPLVVKMRGHSQEEGWKLLEEYQIPTIKYGTTEEAVEELLRIMDGKDSRLQGRTGESQKDEPHYVNGKGGV